MVEVGRNLWPLRSNRERIGLDGVVLSLWSRCWSWRRGSGPVGTGCGGRLRAGCRGGGVGRWRLDGCHHPSWTFLRRGASRGASVVCIGGNLGGVGRLIADRRQKQTSHECDRGESGCRDTPGDHLPGLQLPAEQSGLLTWLRRCLVHGPLLGAAGLPRC